ncbi:hypothetical protein FOFC_08055 [Fusarium oxysporum]|nr:hypothetical protein FOFC_08055 [Fusarium oxysporum]
MHPSVFYACLLSYKLAPFGTVQTLAGSENLRTGTDLLAAIHFRPAWFDPHMYNVSILNPILARKLLHKATHPTLLTGMSSHVVKRHGPIHYPITAKRDLAISMLKQQDIPVLEPPIFDRLNQRLTTAQDREAR